MSRGSEKVKLWRKRTKERLVKAFDGKCCICGIDKIYALDFHHLDPSQKEFTLGSVRGSIKGWDSLVKEVEKCVLVCANCHRGYHAGELFIPENATRFNKEFTTYSKLSKYSKSKETETFLKELIDFCPVCNKEKPIYNKTCSHTCAAK